MPDQQAERTYGGDDLAFLKEQILLAVEGSAYWRRQKAEEYPEDARNARSADALERLSESLAALPSEHQRFRDLAPVSFDIGESAIEAESRFIGRYGFDWEEDADPEAFLNRLREVLLEEKQIEHLPSRPQFYSCFISYSSKDQDFASRLHADLHDKGIRCWFAPEDLKIGDRIRTRIERPSAVTRSCS
jgi:TIR domain